MEEKSKYIASFQVQKMWQRVDVRWDNIHQDVNILVALMDVEKQHYLI